MGFVPRTCSPSIWIDALLSGVLIRDVTMGIPWATASRSGRMHHPNGVNLSIGSPSATRKGASRSVPCPVEHRDGPVAPCGTGKAVPAGVTRKSGALGHPVLAPPSLLVMRLYRHHTHNETISKIRVRLVLLKTP